MGVPFVWTWDSTEALSRTRYFLYLSVRKDVPLPLVCLNMPKSRYSLLMAVIY